MSADSMGTGRADARRSGGVSRPRRAVLTGAAAALGAVAAETLGGAAPAQATQGSAVIEGQDNTGATSRTGVFTPGNNEFGILADPNSSGKGSLGVYGHGQTAGVFGDAGLGGAGVVGTGGPESGSGVQGIGGGNTGTGVIGVGGGTGPGVYGTSDGGGPGVVGFSGAAPPGVVAQNTGGGPALQVAGPAEFSRSGLLTVAAGSSSATQTGVALFPASVVLATLQKDASGVWVRSAVPNIAASSFTVHLSKAAPAATKVAWFVVN